MSELLITHIAVGPKELNESLRDTAIFHADKMVKKAQQFLSSNGKDEHLLEGFDIHWNEELEEIAKNSPYELVDNLLATWRDEFGDVNIRENPNNSEEKIVVAGDMSFGGEPEGFGFQALRKAEQVGLLDIFGIK